MENLYIVMPAYNEEANIRSVIAQWHPVAEKIGGGSKLVIFDDGSKDGTFQTIQECEKEYPCLVGITKENEGHGATLLKAYEYAVSQGAEYIFQTDSDGQTLPGEFWKLWEARESCGLLLGYRKDRQDGRSRVFVTKVLKLVLVAAFGVWVKDANTPFRLMRASQLAQVLKKIPQGFHLSNVVMTVIYQKHHLGLIYYPITFRPRQGGKNSINMRKIFKIGKKALGDFMKMRKTI